MPGTLVSERPGPNTAGQVNKDQVKPGETNPAVQAITVEAQRQRQDMGEKIQQLP